MGIGWSDKRHNYGLLGFYTVVGFAANKAVQATNDPKASLGFLSATCNIWMGLILGVSGMEAWVKFKAPLLPRHVGFDIGRHVFSALSAVETALAVTQIHTLYSGGLIYNLDYSGVPLLMAAVVLLQTAILSPKLERLGKIVISEEGSAAEFKTAKAAKAFASIRQEVEKKKYVKPPKIIHLSYVILELAKVILLGKHALTMW
eukprot:CAMPEP_0184019688 /NCGR_PEP_ID=MMETSP0954-20121128/8901_1 /TAXON_ID=627963 /ORGANISM="Aplanochytrium sp, Strain PBS07" /LENGTH=202 /DNA_ID=CAMNT_0026301403 /DNA_START=96 /DNA_END=701 /DNA_ORIENTATION=-